MSTAPKYNKAEFDAFFERLIAGVDKVIAMNQPDGYVGEDGGFIPAEGRDDA